MMVTPSSQTVEVTLTAVFNTTVTGVGSKTFTYQWYHNGTIISGENGENLVITNMAETKSGIYKCVVINSYNDTAESKAALLMASRE